MQAAYIDAHAHVNLARFDGDREEVIARTAEAGVAFINVGVNEKTSRESAALAEKHEHIFATAGVHPNEPFGEGGGGRAEAYSFIKELARTPHVVGIGECGLDYYRAEKAAVAKPQEERFKKHIAIACEVGKPLMLHIRPSQGTMDAYEDALAILEESKRSHPKLSGNVHFFVGTEEVAQRFNALGFTVSFTGVVTFAPEYAAVVRCVPPDMMLVETDCPYAAPVPYRTERSEPAHVKEIVAAIARIRGEDEGQVARQVKDNATRVFHLPLY